MITILLTVSREEYLTKVISCLESLVCNPAEVNILCIVDGDDALYVKTRNLVSGMKFAERLTVKLDYPGKPSRLDITERRKRIAAAHNQARNIIDHTSGYVFSVEDDTTFGPHTLTRLKKMTMASRAFGFAEGVELGRWGVPYVGAWVADDVYDPQTITSIENIYPVPIGQMPTQIDAGGLYCALISAARYKEHEFHSDNGLGPDVNFGLALRQMGYDNYIVWEVPCSHHHRIMNKDTVITPSNDTKVVTLTKENDTKWLVTY